MKGDGYDRLEDGPSRQDTYNFTVFVFMTIFNFVNARKLNDECNTFSGICQAKLFMTIVGIIFVLQVIITTFGNVPFRCKMWGLGPIGWAIVLAFSVGGNIVNIFIKVINEEKICTSVNFYFYY